MIPRVDILGVGVSAVDLASATAEIRRWIEQREQHYVCVTGVHGVVESQRDDELREIHNRSGLTTPDGMPMVWSARLAGARGVSRVYGPDLMLAVCALAEREGWSCFFYGGREGIPELLASRLTSRFPGLSVAGCWSPPFRQPTAQEDAAVVQLINSSGADIVWVGLSTPKQERWMAEHLSLLSPPVLIGVGAAFDIHAGVLRQAPRWVQHSGLEWAFRLAMEPRRLWRRYAVIIPRFVAGLARQPPRLQAVEPPLTDVVSP